MSSPCGGLIGQIIAAANTSYAVGANLASMEISEADKFDKFCDPKNPVRIQFNDISAAAYRIKGGVEYTPCNVKF